MSSAEFSETSLFKNLRFFIGSRVLKFLCFSSLYDAVVSDAPQSSYPSGSLSLQD